jgi:hypothetical protein
LTKRRDVVEKIAQARKASVAEVLTQPRSNLAKILALLLSQPVADVETSVMETLAAIEPAIRESSNNKLESLVALDITSVAIEILMLAADEDEPKKKPVGRASIVATTTANGFSTTAPLVSLQLLLRPKVDSAQRLPKRRAWIPFAKLKSWVSSRTSQTSSRAL